MPRSLRQWAFALDRQLLQAQRPSFGRAPCRPCRAICEGSVSCQRNHPPKAGSCTLDNLCPSRDEGKSRNGGAILSTWLEILSRGPLLPDPQCHCLRNTERHVVALAVPSI